MLLTCYRNELYSRTIGALTPCCDDDDDDDDDNDDDDDDVLLGKWNTCLFVNLKLMKQN